MHKTQCGGLSASPGSAQVYWRFPRGMLRSPKGEKDHRVAGQTHQVSQRIHSETEGRSDDGLQLSVTIPVVPVAEKPDLDAPYTRAGLERSNS